MSIFRKKKKLPTTARQRLQRSDIPRARPSFSYRSSRSQEPLNTGRQLNREALRPAVHRFKRFWIQRFGLGLLLLALIVSVVNALTLSTNPQIVPLTKTTNDFLHSQATYQDAADKLFASSVWNRNKITVDTGHVSKQLVAQFPELASASVTLPLAAHRPIVYIQPVQAAVALKTSDNLYILGDNGKALLAESEAFATDRSLPIVTDQSGLQVRLGRQALTTADVSFIQTVIAQLAAKQYVVSNLTLPATTRELDVSVDGKPYSVKFNLQSGDARQQAGTFLATMNRLQSEHVTPAQYVDVRVDGRAYYK
ncbi:MAG: hypothetical protein JWL89_254 [Candidatus Saccharibacteria bacterium]|nr:hypothetical protein [Candidatus Saccharibacteria bacterium]